MLNILLFFIGGIIAGRIFRKETWILRSSASLAFAAVLFLLFFLGYQAGNNPHVIGHFDIIGFQGILIGALATLGSILFVSVLARYFSSKK